MKCELKYCVLLGMAAAAAQASSVQMKLEGLKNQEQVANYFNGGTGGGRYDETGAEYAAGGSTGGPNYGISFGGNALAVIGEDYGGTGLFANNPSGSTVLSFNNKINANSFMNVAAGFTTGVAFWYSNPYASITVKIYDGMNATGNLLATLYGPQSATNCPVDKAGKSVANCFTTLGISFQGIAHSVDFTGANFTAFDNIAVGSAVTIPYPPLVVPAGSCPIAAGIKSFILEHPIDGTSFNSAFIPSFAPAQLAVFGDPTKEIHTHFEFSTATMMVTAYSYALPIGGPAIAPPGTDLKDQAIAFATLPIDKVYTTCTPRPAIAVVGYLADSTPVYGSLAGLPHWIAFSYDPTNTTNTFNAANVTTVDAGTTGILGPAGSVIVVPATTTAAITGMPVMQSLYRQLTLDGTPSVTVNGPLTYSWANSGGPGAAILEPTAAQTRIELGAVGDYPITLTVTSAAGEVATATITIHYTGH